MITTVDMHYQEWGKGPPVLAQSVIDLARRLESPPLPRRENRWALVFARLLSPKIAERIPVEKAWPRLKKLADRLEDELEGGEDEHNWTARASKRAIYYMYMACPATRRAFVSAARELALDPAFGPEGVWTRLEHLKIPAAFVWGDEDRCRSPRQRSSFPLLRAGCDRGREPGGGCHTKIGASCVHARTTAPHRLRGRHGHL